jgi:hypothetical protein
MQMAKMAHKAGQLSQDAFDELRNRFNAIHDWALATFGEEALLQALERFDGRHYQPPVAEQNKRQPPKRRRTTCSEDGIAMVDAICEQAIALGWKQARLYGVATALPVSDYPLAACLRPGSRIGQVSRQNIEIILGAPPNEVRQRYYNPDVEQPWIKKDR